MGTKVRKRDAYRFIERALDGIPLDISDPNAMTEVYTEFEDEDGWYTGGKPTALIVEFLDSRNFGRFRLTIERIKD